MCAKTVADNLSKILRIQRIPQQLWDRVDKLLLEKIPIFQKRGLKSRIR